MKIINVVGARPNFMKVAPLHRAFRCREGFTSRIVHTGQHYDERMSDIFFRQLELPEPHVYLGVGSGTHAEQTAQVMTAFEKVLREEKPQLVLVVGDVNSTLACSLVAAKGHVPVAHVEAGLRSFDRRMPEEINRIVTDHVSDYLFVTEESGLRNLRSEGIAEEKVFFVGNVMIDALVRFREKAAQTTVLEDLGLAGAPFALMTAHRPSNVDDPDRLRTLLRIIEAVAAQVHLLFPMHPRTRSRFEAFGLSERLRALGNLTLLEPLGYLEFLCLMEQARLVITDSGGIQEETTYLGVPCATLRENTERPATIDVGTNELLPLDPAAVAEAARRALAGGWKRGGTPPRWDGRAAERIAQHLAERF